MLKQVFNKKKAPVFGFVPVRKVGQIEEYRLLTNGLRVLYLPRPETGVVTTNITYMVGARDEDRGETGLAHMLEHMLFKPTERDLKRKIKSGAAMEFERQTGSILNANTWKDRTTYYFSYPKKFFKEALAIEADRMQGVVLDDKTLKPEQNNVLSEFDMYNGDPSFALAVEMYSAAFYSHPYGHETIGYREDVEDYTAEKLQRFYKNYYRPDNAVLMIVGDIEREKALREVKRLFATKKNPPVAISRYQVREPKQAGVRRVEVKRPSTTNIIQFGFKHQGFPGKGWFTASVLLEALTAAEDGILHKLWVDSGKASQVRSYLEPTKDENLAIIEVYLAEGIKHQDIENDFFKCLASLDKKELGKLVKKTKAGMITDELFARTDSLHIVGELTEYVSADASSSYSKTEQILSSITVSDVLDLIKEALVIEKMCIGNFIGLKQK